MFKKRSRPQSVREKPSVESESTSTPEPTTTDSISGPSNPPPVRLEEDDTTQNIEELILLRKLRKSKQGIDLERLNRGEERKSKKSDASEQYGLQSVTGKKGDKDDEFADDVERARRLIKTNNFTKQTNALDVDKHMLAYIESELQKRRGRETAFESSINEAFDPTAELFRIADRFKKEAGIVAAGEEDEEGNVTNSLGMLTSIPEVDLGMDNRLKNIELTEKAKRDMMEQRKAEEARRAQKRPEDEDYAAARFFKPHQRVPSDAYAFDDAKRDAANALPATAPPPRKPRTGHETATDEQVYERFKKRMKR
ncbi:hepatocellular carcinoma-associated antigen 59-domain-containing protein [Naematelia encephala]|uniref:Hepatocellular carcinoma-associated antigen 59-domain-containing protein n=1 Tax=Naematelia encephala TaxID=71784 RepID=A0A1Y2ARP3_9TREE|nr:hepatocellular carcinoma-associated antigen 59-domain-containing protein [Naematelia encephala]